MLNLIIYIYIFLPIPLCLIFGRGLKKIAGIVPIAAFGLVYLISLFIQNDTVLTVLNFIAMGLPLIIIFFSTILLDELEEDIGKAQIDAFDRKYEIEKQAKIDALPDEFEIIENIPQKNSTQDDES
ncbi:hypothetical protein QA601_14810 [Chitinispirillales bacterium ANBcel5]|uniref:hypothetical protein n=1 Tax=Cellulosispirillum alkaliphilum TaxID=3039283 RepID=UPI002A5209D1|nr:hypothetical protein [Chitinispirillales bacterium ANBcel5]